MLKKHQLDRQRGQTEDKGTADKVEIRAKFNIFVNVIDLIIFNVFSTEITICLSLDI